ncbi:metallophosphoesterase [Rufibacter psychrotolerans]|uniref:metallophosphoesterase n=1 Tax=Rufibacter psychrotolerans TaxID=2812556 RepID=UPI0019671D48|nr:metallophosphoesterase [Rufibacter sp. SYSU D00308]
MFSIKDKRLQWGLGLAAAGALGVLLDSFFLEKYFFAVKTFDLGKPTGGKTLQLLHLTDLHLQKRLHPQHRKLAAKINQLQPDLLLFSGDTLDSSGHVAAVEQFLGLIAPQIRKVAIPGNHDYLAADPVAELKATFERHNGHFLVNQSQAFTLRGVRVMVTGLDDFVESEGNLEKAVQNVGHEPHHLLLLHSPLQQEETKAALTKINQRRAPAERLNIQYIFAGHNHGGQIRLPGYVPVLPKKSGSYVQGWYNTQAPFLYLSRGFGTSRIPFRFFARAEITLFRYHV